VRDFAATRIRRHAEKRYLPAWLDENSILPLIPVDWMGEWNHFLEPI
jgi:hypothetical protein